MKKEEEVGTLLSTPEGRACADKFFELNGEALKEADLKLSQRSRQTTHHNACDCREEYFKKLEEEVLELRVLINRVVTEIQYAHLDMGGKHKYKISYEGQQRIGKIIKERDVMIRAGQKEQTDENTG